MRKAVAVGVLLLVVGCGGGADQTAATPTPTAQEIATEIDPELLAPLEGLGPCSAPPAAMADVGDVAGLPLLPPDAVVTGVTAQGPVTQIDGWVPLTPIGVRADYVTRDDLQVLTVEDEIWESETLVTDGTHRVFLKAQGICRTSSVFVALVSAEAAADG